MAEQYTLTTPTVIPEVVNNYYKITALFFEWEDGRVSVHLRGQNNEIVQTGYGGPLASPAERDEAIKMMRQLNTANLTVKSLQKRVLEKLAADGKLPSGSVTGTPDPAALADEPAPDDGAQA